MVDFIAVRIWRISETSGFSELSRHAEFSRRTLISVGGGSNSGLSGEYRSVSPLMLGSRFVNGGTTWVGRWIGI